MITSSLLEQFVARAQGQALSEGRRYAAEGRVGHFIGSSESALSVVRGQSGDFDVVLWAEGSELAHRCSCPSWRDPCKHEVAAALKLLELRARPGVPGRAAPQAGLRRSRSLASGARAKAADSRVAGGDPETARREALAERVAAARRGGLSMKLGAEAGTAVVRSASRFAYQLTIRGGAAGPHGCDCPDFEANRLHTCKHVERLRRELETRPLPREHRVAAHAARVYLHFGEVVEPRLFRSAPGEPEGASGERVRSAFDASGVPLAPLARDERDLLAWLRELAPWVEPQALSWLERRIARRPVLPARPFAELLPALGIEPYAFQWEGAAFLARAGRALLADEMGLGKTVQAIVAALGLRRAERPARRVTVVCPASLRGAWSDEITRISGEPVRLLEGTSRERSGAISGGAAWLVTHYEQLLRDHEAHRAAPPDLLIVDEAQRAKGLLGRTARLLKSIECPYVFALTGTPLVNRLEEAYAIAQLIDQRLLPPLWQLDRDHFVREAQSGRVVLYRNLGAMRSRLAPAFLRRRKEDVARELPPQLRSVVRVPMHPDVSGTYAEVMAQVAALARGATDPERLQRLLVVARRCCNGPQMLNRSVADAKVPKLREMEEALRELCVGEGRKAVVFSEWSDMTERVVALVSRLGLRAYHLHGKVPVGRRAELVSAFSNEPGPAVFVSTDAGSEGLGLAAADVVVSLDLPWSPARLEQRLARVHRIGSRASVQVLLLVTRDSLEERILGLHERKRKLSDNVWTRDGAEQVAAPGAGSALPELVRSLLEETGPAEPSLAKLETALEERAMQLGAPSRGALAARLRALAERLLS